jgi:hypothetical protein
MTARSVGRPLVALQNLHFMRDFILVSNPTSAKNVERPSGSTHSSFCITELTQVRSPMYVKIVGRLLFVAPNLLFTGEFILVLDLTSVKSVGKPSDSTHN